jgi:hypothetical protein
VQGFLSEWGPSHDVVESHLTAAKPPPGRRRIRAARLQVQAQAGDDAGPQTPVEPPDPD